MTGQSNLNFSNFKTVLLSPWSIPLFILYLLAFAFLIFMEFSILIFMIYGTIRGIHFSWRSSIQNAFSELKQLLNGHFITFWLYFLTLLPLINIGELTFISKKIAIPEFITDEITKDEHRNDCLHRTGCCPTLLSRTKRPCDSTSDSYRPAFYKKYCHKLEVNEKEYCAVALYFGSRRRGPCDSRYFYLPWKCRPRWILRPRRLQHASLK